MSVLYSGLGLYNLTDLVFESESLMFNIEQEGNQAGDDKTKLDTFQDSKILTSVELLSGMSFSIEHYLQDHPEYWETHVLQVPTPPPEC
ncbi:MAG: hypothetical protein CMN32_08470 [Saprospirales bacterium]|nr:hypothetical protein [Saprospirales bacterium]